MYCSVTHMRKTQSALRAAHNIAYGSATDALYFPHEIEVYLILI